MTTTERPLPLTDAEVETLQLAANGLDSRAMAKHLSITEDGIRLRFNRMFKKLGARNRVQAVAMAMRAGMIR